MNNIIMYTKTVCPFCVRAKMLLKNKGQTFTEIDATDENTMSEMIEKSGGRKTVPQIFINDTHVGGFDDLQELDLSGELDKMLN